MEYGVIQGCGTRGMVFWVLLFHYPHNPQLTGHGGKIRYNISILRKLYTSADLYRTNNVKINSDITTKK
jgi:hypothetical protein